MELNEDDDRVLAQHGDEILARVVFELKLIFDKKNFQDAMKLYQDAEGTKCPNLDDLIEWFFENYSMVNGAWSPKFRYLH